MTPAPQGQRRLAGLEPTSTSLDLQRYGVEHRQPFTCSIRVGPEQIGQVIHHVSNIEYVRWLDRAAELHADSLGFTRAWLVEQQMMWFVARHEIDYLAEVWLQDELIIATWVRDIRKVKSWRDYIIIRPADQTTVCRASTLWVLVDLQTRKPTRLTGEMIARFNPLQSVAMSPG